MESSLLIQSRLEVYFRIKLVYVILQTRASKGNGDVASEYLRRRRWLVWVGRVVIPQVILSAFV